VKIIKRLALTCAVIFVSSCTNLPDDNSGKLVVLNKSGSPSAVITDVWLSADGSGEWINYWHGSCPGLEDAETELSFTAGSGVYNVKIQVTLPPPFFYERYETGYRHPVKLGNKGYAFIIFDGHGIYDMEDG
jgi:hypothetical protein